MVSKAIIMANIVANALNSDDNSKLHFMAFGNGGTSVDTAGKVIYKSPRVSESFEASADLYSRSYNKIISANTATDKIEVVAGSENESGGRQSAGRGGQSKRPGGHDQRKGHRDQHVAICQCKDGQIHGGDVQRAVGQAFCVARHPPEVREQQRDVDAAH